MTVAFEGRSTARADGRACRDVIRRHSKSFYLSAMLLPPSVREAAFALYAFCRHADDAVDEAPGHQDPLAAVERLRRRLDAAYRGAALDQPVDRAFSHVVDRFGIPRAVPESLLDGMEMDARGVRYDTERDLLLYAFRVASSVGLMMTRVMGPSSPDAYLRAADLGVAMQLTNIARDVGEDARMGRCYLPGELLDSVGLSRERLSAPRADAAAKEAVRRLLATAEAHYAAADAGIGYLPGPCRLAITSARLIYAEIGEAIAHQHHDTLASRAFVPLGRKLQLVGQAVGRLSHPADPAHRGPADAALAAMIRGVGLGVEGAA